MLKEADLELFEKWETRLHSILGSTIPEYGLEWIKNDCRQIEWLRRKLPQKYRHALYATCPNHLSPKDVFAALFDFFGRFIY